ncbi:MAG: DEAD/DEAH box helicase [Bacteroidales bacterium]|nr:DEAD/DEAH box helicase [Bacteroidales bacterium]
MTRQQLTDTARQRLGIAGLNDLQQRVWSSAARRLCVLSPTGSGKTLAFAGLMLQRIGRPDGRVQALVLAPSRELVLQIYEVVRRLAGTYKVAAFYGKHSMTDEINTLRAVPDIIVATPGRLLDHLQRRTVAIHNPAVLVIDEYDKALEMGFHDEMSRICRRTGTPGSVILTSATALDIMPDFIDMHGAETIANTTVNVADRLHIAHVESPARDKLDTLVGLLRSLPQGRVIIFVNHRESAERVAARLVAERLPAGLYHGGLEQEDRDRAIIRLNNGSTPVLVATDLGSRGLDISDVQTVIHYHLPPSAAAWTHRNGRTARVDADGNVYVITCEGENVPDYVSWQHDYVPTGHNDSPLHSDTVTLYINAGKREKISRGDIVGFLVKQAGLAPDSIGKIDVRDHSAYVAVPRSALPSVAAAKDARLKGIRVRISPLK